MCTLCQLLFAGKHHGLSIGNTLDKRGGAFWGQSQTQHNIGCQIHNDWIVQGAY